MHTVANPTSQNLPGFPTAANGSSQQPNVATPPRPPEASMVHIAQQPGYSFDPVAHQPLAQANTWHPGGYHATIGSVDLRSRCHDWSTNVPISQSGRITRTGTERAGSCKRPVHSISYSGHDITTSAKRCPTEPTTASFNPALQPIQALVPQAERNR